MENQNIIEVIVSFLEKNIGKKALTSFEYSKKEEILSFGVRSAKFKIIMEKLICLQEVEFDTMIGKRVAYTETHASTSITNWLREYIQNNVNDGKTMIF